MNTFKLLFISTLYALSHIMLITSTQAWADTENIRDGAYLDIGIGLGVESDPFIFDDENDSGFDLYINGRYQKYGFFVEFPHGTSKQQATVLSFGYNFLNTDNWAYDLQLAMNHRDLDHILPESHINSRRVSHSKLGLRILGDFDNTHLKLIVAGASGDPDGGLYTSAWLSQNYNFYNWNVYASFGVEYRNKDVVNYFYGINEIEGLAYYRGEAGFEYTGQVGASYPINEDWVFEGFIRTTLLPSGVSESPLVDGNKVAEAALVVKYVF
ncbi:MipA/OmpV family protein [Pseudoalteromonas tunicata]|uniref:MipA/OmpV family protein n=1 Tax=Pseudoalteromonas tunicata TaxID=314281 RepID=UPI00273E3E26|nr:MipA/OmpV family protein [Pseudoalteromonas tunicata]MDP5213356.1 MipA/OmpV family protein [Pseudoalteromonas tunicata]